MGRPTLRRTAVLVAAVAMATTAAPAAAHHHNAPSPGSAGIGDVLFPTLGNGGYDRRHYSLALLSPARGSAASRPRHYSLALRYPTADPGSTVQGRITMFARATQALSRFDL